MIFRGTSSNSEQPHNSQNINECIDSNSLIRDRGLDKQIENYYQNKKDLVRRVDIDLGPHQSVQVYPLSGPEHHPHICLC